MAEKKKEKQEIAATLKNSQGTHKPTNASPTFYNTATNNRVNMSFTFYGIAARQPHTIYVHVTAQYQPATTCYNFS